MKGPRYLLDTSALLALRDNEPGADRVNDLLQAAATGDAGCLALPIEWVHESAALLQQAGAIKACHPLSLADAWIAAAALETDAILVHKDPEFEGLPGLLEERLPYR